MYHKIHCPATWTGWSPLTVPATLVTFHMRLLEGSQLLDTQVQHGLADQCLDDIDEMMMSAETLMHYVAHELDFQLTRKVGPSQVAVTKRHATSALEASLMPSTSHARAWRMARCILVTEPQVQLERKRLHEATHSASIFILIGDGLHALLAVGHCITLGSQ